VLSCQWVTTTAAFEASVSAPHGRGRERAFASVSREINWGVVWHVWRFRDSTATARVTSRILEELTTDYRRDGFAFRTGLLSAAEAGVLAHEAERLISGERPPDRFLLEKDGVTVRTMVNPHLYSDVFARLVRHPTLLATARALLDDEVYVFQLGVNHKAGFNGDVWFWHQDYPGYHIDDHIPTPNMVNTLVFLDDVNVLNGPLMIVPRSHRHVPECPEVSDKGTSYAFRYADNATVTELVRDGGIVAPTGPAGSVIFMNVNTMHGSTANLSPWPRRMITLTYNAMSNKATSPSTRAKHIVYDDRDLAALVPMHASCLDELAEAALTR
jgi:ectoine hydroxylase